jgi:hypothetical protein
MCNNLHAVGQATPRPIRKTGVGYKLFGVNNTGLFTNQKYHCEDKEGFICWNQNLYYSDHVGGFCFFLSKREATRLRKDLGWVTCVIKKIAYQEGLGRRTETNIVVGRVYEMGLCRQFKILEGRV